MPNSDIDAPIFAPEAFRIATADAKKGLGTTNWGRYSNPGFDRAFEAAIAIIDDEKRASAATQLVEHVLTQVEMRKSSRFGDLEEDRSAVKAERIIGPHQPT